MYTTSQDLRLISQKVQDKRIKIELLDKKTNIILEEIEGALISDSGTIDRTSNCRRTYNADFYVENSTFLVDEGNKVWMDKYLRVQIGILDIRLQEYVWYTMGVFAISETGYSYSPSDNTVSLTLMDKMAFLDGTLGGVINGMTDMKIQRFVNDKYYSTVTLDKDKRFVTFGAGTIITIPIPTSNSENVIKSFKIKSSIFESEKTSDKNSDAFLITYTKNINGISETINAKCSLNQFINGYVVEGIDTYNIADTKITMLNDTDIVAISTYANNINPTIVLAEYLFNGNNNIIDPTINTSDIDYQRTTEYLDDYQTVREHYENGDYSNSENDFQDDLNNLKIKYGVIKNEALNADMLGNSVLTYNTPSSKIDRYIETDTDTTTYQECLTYLADYKAIKDDWDSGTYYTGTNAYNDYKTAINGLKSSYTQKGYSIGLDDYWGYTFSYYVVTYGSEPKIKYKATEDCKSSYNNALAYLSEYDGLVSSYQNGEYDDMDNQYSIYTQHLSDLCNMYGYSLYQDNFGNNVVNGYVIQFSPSDGTWQIVGYADNMFTNLVKYYKPTSLLQNWTVDNIVIDTTTGRETFIEDVIKAGLETLGVNDYEIQGVHEVIPYDQEFSTGDTWFDVFDTLIKLYQDIEMYFDECGTFVVRYYSTTQDNDIVIDNDTLQPLVTNISYSNSFQDIHNVSEVWGTSIKSDCYAENSDDEPYLVTCSDNNFSVNFTDLTLTDNGKISDNTVLAFKTPSDMVLTDSPTLTVNSIKTVTANIEKIDKVYTFDSLEESTSSVTGYKIDEDSVYSFKIGNLTLYTEDIMRNKANSYKNIPANGAENWSNYGARSANKTYKTSNNTTVSMADVLGTNTNPVTVDGISFYGAFYNMLNASEMVGITGSTYSINLDIKKYCIQIDATKGEIYRFYYTNLSGNLYCANANGVFKKKDRPFILYTNADTGMSYCDFVAESTGTFYIFWYSTDSSDISFRLYGISKITAKQGEYPILNYTDGKPVDYTIFQPNTSYCVEYINGKIYYLGQWQIHAVAVEVLTIPQKNSDEYNHYVGIFNCNNIIFTQRDSRFAIESIGIKTQSLSGDVYEEIWTDDLALQRAEYENWKSIRLADSVTLTTIQIPWLDVSEKLTYQLPNKQLKTYMVESISYSNTSDTMSITMSTFYPLYMS